MLPKKVQSSAEALKDTVRQELELCCVSDYFLAKRGLNVPVHPVHKMKKLVLLGGQDGHSRKGGNQINPCIHAYFRLYSLEISNLPN